MASSTQDSLASAASGYQTLAATAAIAMQAQASQNSAGPSRLPLALHYPQSAIHPGSSYSNPPNGQPATPKLGGAGYGPPVLISFTPIQKLVHETVEQKRDYDLVCLPLTTPRWKDRWERMCVTSAGDEASNGIQAGFHKKQASSSAYEAERWRSGGGFSRGEVNATRSDETRLLIALASEWLELDSEVEGIRFDSEIALKQEVAYASHLHISSLILPMPRNPDYLADYARAVNAALNSCAYMHIAIRIPISKPLPSSPSVASTSMPQNETSSSPWDTWNLIRQLCSYSNRLHVCLDLTFPVPPSPSQLARWQAESLKAIWLPATTFIPNAKGYPVLSKGLQSFLKSVFKYKPSVILSGTHTGLHANGGPEAYAQYVRFLERKMPPETPVEQYAGGYLDYLQAPLQVRASDHFKPLETYMVNGIFAQPLMDNLESDTYEGFEKDPIKYQQYEEAVYQALMDMPPIQSAPVEIFVAGAGRGPLVAGCLKAAKRAGGKRVKITAIEKNPNAYVVLQERKAIEWGSYVDLVFTDMRSFHPTILADIIVSELLGSFGDNELSPECLDGIIPRLLKPEGISIPYSYTSYLAPITSSKLHEQITSAGDVEKAEQPYVVMFSQALIISDQHPETGREKVQGCWNFVHPRNDVVLDEQGLPLTNAHNSRSAQLSFWIPNATVCHGFGGYFEALLYGDVAISIHPEKGDPNMLSWFPIFFPLREPIYLPARSELDVRIWRLTDPVKRRIWFEWSAEAFLPVSGLSLSTSIGPSGANSASYLSPRPMTPGTPAWGDAFMSAPSPALNRNPNDPMHFEEQQNQLLAQQRIKIGMSKLHNPLGRSSWVGL